MLQAWIFASKVTNKLFIYCDRARSFYSCIVNSNPLGTLKFHATSANHWSGDTISSSIPKQLSWLSTVLVHLKIWLRYKKGGITALRFIIAGFRVILQKPLLYGAAATMRNVGDQPGATKDCRLLQNESKYFTITGLLLRHFLIILFCLTLISVY